MLTFLVSSLSSDQGDCHGNGGHHHDDHLFLTRQGLCLGDCLENETSSSRINTAISDLTKNAKHVMIRIIISHQHQGCRHQDTFAGYDGGYDHCFLMKLMMLAVVTLSHLT